VGRWRRLIVVVATGAAVGAGCAGDASPTVPARTYPGLQAGGTVRLEIDALAEDAVQPEALRALLDRAGLEGAVERTFVGSEALRSVTARIVDFTSERGAREYLGWLEEHAADLLGESEEEAGIDLANGASASAFTAVPGGCCPKAMTTSLAVWQRGTRVLTVLAVGGDADASGLAALARDLDDAAGVTTQET
jgi:hypothetical protein